MNKVFLVGNLTRDPELSTVGASGASVCKFGIAVNRRVGGNQETDFYNITAWRMLGENCAKFIKKGSKVGIVGNIQTRSYDAQDGTKRYVFEIVAEEVEFLASKGASNSEEAEAPAAE